MINLLSNRMEVYHGPQIFPTLTVTIEDRRSRIALSAMTRSSILYPPSSCSPRLSVGLRFCRFDPNLLQRLGLWIELCFASRKAVDFQHMAQDINYLLPGQLPKLIWRHRPANSLG